MPEEDSSAGEMEQGEQVLDVTLPAGDEPTAVVQPKRRSIFQRRRVRRRHRPSCGLTTTAAMGRDHLDPVGGHQLLIECVAIVAAIADQTRGEVREEAGVEGGG